MSIFRATFFFLLFLHGERVLLERSISKRLLQFNSATQQILFFPCKEMFQNKRRTVKRRRSLFHGLRNRFFRSKKETSSTSELDVLKECGSRKILF